MVCTGTAIAAPSSPDAVPVESPHGQLRLALTDLARIEGQARKLEADPAQAVALAQAATVRKDLLYYRYVSFATVPASGRTAFRRVFRFWLNHMSASRSLVPEYEVPGSQGTLIRIDIRDAPNWTRAAWVLVADRDYLFREPLLPNRETVYGRLVTGIDANPDTLAAGFLLNGYQLFRDTIEAERVPSYYDLLYGAERHPDPDDGKTFVGPVATAQEPQEPKSHLWPGGVWPADGQFYPAGSFSYQRKEEVEQYQKDLAAWKANKANKANQGALRPLRLVGVQDANRGEKDFPKTGVDFERRWDGEVKAEDIKRLRIDPRVGGIAAGADSDPKSGSYVALNDRAIRIVPTRFGFVARTYDVFKNAGDKDHIERFREIALNQAQADAGELLASLPNGAQAGLLVNAVDAVVNVADTRLAQIRGDKIDPRYKDVRTMMGCTGCHAPVNGFVSFVEQYRDSAEKGVKFKVREEEQQAIRDFYESWAEDVKLWQAPYARYLERSTRDEKGKPWTGTQTWEAMRSARDWYDLPVTLEVAAMEFGVPVEVLRQRLLGERESDSPIEARLNQLVVGKAIPRTTWEAEVAGKMSAFLDSIRGKDEPLKDLLAPEIIADALKRFGHPEKQK